MSYNLEDSADVFEFRSSAVLGSFSTVPLGPERQLGPAPASVIAAAAFPTRGAARHEEITRVDQDARAGFNDDGAHSWERGWWDSLAAEYGLTYDGMGG